MKKVLFRKRKVMNENIGNVFANMPNEFSNFSPYSYELLGFDHRLEQKGNSLPSDRYINVGSYIEGFGYSDRNTIHTGVVKNIIKDELGYIKYLIILDDKISRFVKIYPDKIKLLK